jgi:BASS family bile acid:Na+ symporter
MPGVKLANLAVIVALNYSNAALALPRVLATPDPDYLALVGAVTGALCAAAFACGWRIGPPLGAGLPERVSLLFGLGMNNNGSGLVLASATLADHPNVLLGIVVYNLVQQIAAGIADRFAARRLAQAA